MNSSSILTDAEIRNRLTQKLQGEDIAAEVATEALEHTDIPAFFSDLAEHGCICGMV